MPELLHAPAAPAAPRTRRLRRRVLALLRHTFLSISLLGAAATVTGFVITARPDLSARIAKAIETRLTRDPDQFLREIGEATAQNEPAAIIAAARRFLGSIERPHPADRYGEDYRRTLRALTSAAETAGDQAARLEAGALASAFDPNDSWLMYHYGKALRASAQRDLARPVLENAFRIRPSSAHVYAELRALYAEISPTLERDLAARHHQAPALMMDLPTWMTGNLVAVSHLASAVVNPRMSVEQETLIDLPLDFAPSSLYLVLPKVAELELKFEEAALVAPDGARIELTGFSQPHLKRLEDGYVRITPDDAVDFDAAGVIDFPLPDAVPPKSRLIMRIAGRPSPEVAAQRRDLGLWSGPVSPSAQSHQP